ncbi:bZIP transcription factor 60-like [Nicotiana tabacum]|uniref:Basic region leucine zipper protein n=1 Tax=Nicotiana tabacum TaxID=4097 RepID=A7VKB4_TOBAC|nr:bZIP transcription factor 60-like [Nicotiana tabacum]BAF76429.1 basic region leucine zipper protein [Nicotiana tabacum]
MVGDIDDIVGHINWDDVDHLFHNILEDPADNLFSAHDPSAPSIQEIEQLLMNDDDIVGHVAVGEPDFQLADDFLSDVLADSPVQSDHSPSDKVIGFYDSKVSSGSEVDDDDKDKEKVSQSPIESKDGSDELNSDDPVDKKRKRQLRNRDAAVRSRERKKLYVRDLELKSRYFESECKRLGLVLQCCLAENQALRFSLQSSSANGACMTKQESAVLLLESLLLGSLLWFMGIICLLILPSQPWLIPEENQRSRNHGLLVPIKGGNKTGRIFEFLSLMMGKRCKASRSRMKFNPHYLGIVM